MKRRYPIAIGLVFAVIATVYGLVSHDAGGTTTLGGLAIAMTVLAYFLLAGTGDLQG